MRSPPATLQRRILCIHLPPDSVKDQDALARLAEHCERYSPIVGWETVESGVGSQESGVGRRVGPASGASAGPPNQAEGGPAAAAALSHPTDFGFWLDVTGIG